MGWERVIGGNSRSQGGRRAEGREAELTWGAEGQRMEMQPRVGRETSRQTEDWTRLGSGGGGAQQAAQAERGGIPPPVRKAGESK